MKLLREETFKAPRGFSATGVQSMRSHVIFTYKTTEAEIRAVLSPIEAAQLAKALKSAIEFSQKEYRCGEEIAK